MEIEEGREETIPRFDGGEILESGERNRTSIAQHVRILQGYRGNNKDFSGRAFT